MDTLKNEIIKARKPHRCYWCGSEIKKGERYRRLVEVDGGYFSHLALHTECDRAWLRENKSNMGNGEITPYENSRGLTWYEEEELDTP